MLSKVKRRYYSVLAIVLLLLLLAILNAKLRRRKLYSINQNMVNFQIFNTTVTSGNTTATVMSSECLPPTKWGDTIPRVIHQMYDTALLPTQFQKYVSSWPKVYPNATYMFWSDADISAFIEDHYSTKWRNIFHKELVTGVEKADVARILILNHFGGIYADLDVMAVRPADNLLKKHGLIVATEPGHHSYFLYDAEFVPSNAIMASHPLHKFWCYVLQHFPHRLRSKYGTQIKERQTRRSIAVYATGPMMVKDMLNEYKYLSKNCKANDKKCQIYLAKWQELQPKYDEGDLTGTVKGKCKPFLSVKTNSYKTGSLDSKKWLLCQELKRNNFKSVLYNNSVTYHDFLHLTYYKERQKFTKVNVTKWVPNAVFYLKLRSTGTKGI